jgi:hypothetical protein
LAWCVGSFGLVLGDGGWVWFPESGGWAVAGAAQWAGPLVGAVGESGVGPAAAVFGPVVVGVGCGEVVGVGGAAGGVSWPVGGDVVDLAAAGGVGAADEGAGLFAGDDELAE